MAKAAGTKKSVKEAVKKPVKKILISQPKPETEKSPYYDLSRKYGVELDFHPFIKVEGVSSKDFRKQKIDLANYSAVVLTSRNAVDHFFRICEEMKFKVSQDLKYFCITEAVALYLQKFVQYRKRKVFFGADGSMQSLIDVIAKQKTSEKYLISGSGSDSTNKEISAFLLKNNHEFAEAALYRTVSSDVREVLQKGVYDLIVFFSPFGVKSLFENDPEFKQNSTYIGAFGPTTSKAVEEYGLVLSVKAPMPETPSMASAIDRFLSELNK
jgi:uroporphyrinogen-III synthase